MLTTEPNCPSTAGPAEPGEEAAVAIEDLHPVQAVIDDVDAPLLVDDQIDRARRIHPRLVPTSPQLASCSPSGENRTMR